MTNKKEYGLDYRKQCRAKTNNMILPLEYFSNRFTECYGRISLDRKEDIMHNINAFEWEHFVEMQC